LKHPDRFLEFPSDQPTLVRWNGHVAELLEYMIPLQLSGKLLKPSGEPMNYSDMVRFINGVFGITIKKSYEIKTKLLSRKKRVTPFIDKMRLALVEEAKKLLL
jgi:hypothetical protein